MRKLQITAALIIAFISVGLQAGVQEKKTLRNAQATADTAAETVQKACGNEALSFTLDWKAFDGYDYTTSNYDRYGAMGLFGNTTKKIAKILADLCADPDYKEEIAKLTEVHFSGSQNLDDSRTGNSFVLNGTTLKLVLVATRAIQSYHKKGVKDAF